LFCRAHGRTGRGRLPGDPRRPAPDRAGGAGATGAARQGISGRHQAQRHRAHARNAALRERDPQGGPVLRADFRQEGRGGTAGRGHGPDREEDRALRCRRFQGPLPGGPARSHQAQDEGQGPQDHRHRGGGARAAARRERGRPDGGAQGKPRRQRRQGPQGPAPEGGLTMAGKAEDLLRDYRAKRNFARTQEPSGDDANLPEAGRGSFVVQKHDATRLHYDFRIELDGVLKSWAVTKGPSNNPADKRLAVRVEDHPLDYGSFEGTIPEGQYGGGTVMLWDRGTWEPIGDPHEGLESGDLKMRIYGERLKGEYVLVHMKGRDTASRSSPPSEKWL